MSGSVPVTAVCESLEQRVLLALASWDGGGDGQSWTDPLNWSADVLPGAHDHVRIDRRGEDRPLLIELGDEALDLRSLKVLGDAEIASGTIRTQGRQWWQGSVELDEIARLESRFGAIRLGAERAAWDDARTAARLLGTARAYTPITLALAGEITARRVLLDAGPAGSVRIDGLIVAPGRLGKGVGGRIDVLGRDLVLTETAELDASGARRGGQIRIGGEYLGRGPLPNATSVLVSSGATIHADATERGRGGRVIVWSDDTTIYDGLVTARGGPRGGDGGFIETSGKNILSVTTGLGDASAVEALGGTAGTWLMDPRSVTISNSATTSSITVGAGNPRTYSVNAFNPPPNIVASSINTALNAGTNVIVTTSFPGSDSNVDPGDITVNSILSKTNAGLVSLTLRAADDIIINAGIQATVGSLNVTLIANDSAQWGEEGPGPWEFQGNISVNAQIVTNGGTLTATGVNFTNSAAGVISSGAGAITINTANAAFSGNVSTAIGGSITVHASGLLDPFTPFAAGGSLSFGATGVSFSSATISLRTSVPDRLIAFSADNLNVVTNAPVFRNVGGGATNPTAFTIRKTEDLTDANIPAGTQFGAGTPSGITYTIQSDDTVTIATATKVTGARLIPEGSLVAINTPLSLTGYETGAGSGTHRFTGNITTTSDIQLTRPVEISGANVTLNAGGLLVISNTVSDFSAGSNILTLQGASIGVTGAIGSLTNFGLLNFIGSTSLAANVASVGGILFQSAVTLSLNGTVTVSGQSIVFASTVDAQGGTTPSLVVNSSGGGTTTFSGSIGTTNALVNLTTNADGVTRLAGATLAASGNVTFNDAVELDTAAVTLNVTGNSTFNSTLNSHGSFRQLIDNTAGATTFNGVVGGVLPLNTYQRGFSGTTAVNADMTTQGTLLHNRATTIGGGTVELISNTSNVSFNSTLAVGGNDLLVSGATVDFLGGANSVTGSLSLTLLPISAGSTVGIGGGAGSFNLDDTDLAALAEGFSLIEIGRDDGSAAFAVSSSTFRDDVRLRTGSGTITVSGAITTTASVTFASQASGTTQLNVGQAIPGTLTFNSPLRLNGSFTIAAGTLNFNSTVDSLTTNRPFTANTTGGGVTTFGGAIGGLFPLSTITTNADGTTVINPGCTLFQATGAITFNDAVSATVSIAPLDLVSTGATGSVVLSTTAAFSGRPVTITSGSNGVDFLGGANSVTGSGTLSLRPNSDGLAWAVGGGVSAFVLSTADLAAISAGFAEVIVGRSTSTAAGTINPSTFNPGVSFVGAGSTVSVNGPLTSLNGRVQFSVSSVVLGASVTAQGIVTFAAPVQLSAAVIVTGASVEFEGSVDSTSGNQALTVSTDVGGTSAFEGPVGSLTPLLSLTTDADGTTILGGNVTTIGDILFNDPVLLRGDTIVTANDVTFNQVINSETTARSLTVNTSGSGVTLLQGQIGFINPLAGLTTNADGTTDIRTTVITTTATGDVLFGDAVVITAVACTVTANDITFSSTINDSGTGNGLIVNTVGGGLTTFGAGAGNLVPLESILTNADGTTVLGGSITVGPGGSITMLDAVELNADITLTGPTILLGSTVNRSSLIASAALTLAPSVGGTATINGAIGNIRSLAGLGSPVASGTVVLTGGSVVLSATGDVNFQSQVDLNADTVITANDAAFASLQSFTVTPRALTINTTGGGVTTFNGSVGTANPLASIITNADGTTAFIGSVTVRTSGNQAYNDAVTFTGARTFQALDPGSVLTFTGTITAGANTVIMTADDLVLPTSGISGTGTWTLQQATLSRNVTVGNTSAGTLSVSTAELTALPATLASITIGRNDATGVLTINNATPITLPATSVRFVMGGVGATIRVEQALNTTSTLTFTAPAATTGTFMAADINATTLIANGTFNIEGARTINAGSVTFNSSTRDSPAAGADSLAVNLAPGGVLNFWADQGESGAYALTVNGNGTTNIRGNQHVFGDTVFNNAVVVSSPNINNPTFQLRGDLRFASTFNSIDGTARNVRFFTGNSGTRLVRFDSAVGNANPLGTLDFQQGGLGNYSVRLAGGTYTATGAVLAAPTVPFQIAGDTTITAASITLGGAIDADVTASRRLFLNTTGGGITTLGPVGQTVPLATLDTNNDGTTVLNGPISTTGGIILLDPVTFAGTSGTITQVGGALTFGSTVNGGSRPLQFTTQDPVFNGTVSGSGTLVMQPGVAATNITIGASTPMFFTLTASELGQLSDGFASITIGRADGTGILSVDAPATFTDPLTLRMAGTGGSIAINAALSALAGLTIQGSGSTTTINANITTAGAPLTFADAVRIGGASISLDTTNGGTVPVGAGITFDFAVDSEAGEANSLTLIAGTSGQTLFSGVVGGAEPLNALTTDAMGSTLLRGNVTAVGTVTLNDGVVIGGPVTLTAPSVFFEGVVETDLLLSNRTLTVNVSNLALFRQTIGASVPLHSLTATGAGSARFGGNVTLSTNLAMSVPVTINNSPNFTAPLMLFTSTINPTGSGSTISFNGNSTGDIVFSGAVGGTLPFQSMSVSGALLTTFGANVAVVGPLTLNGPVATGALAVSTLSGSSVLFGSTVTVSPGSELTVRTDTPTFTGIVTGTGGSLGLEPATVSSNVTVGGAGGAGYLVSASLLSQFTGTYAAIRVGRLDGTGLLFVNPLTTSNSIEFRMAGPGGGIRVNGALTGSGTAGFTFRGSGSTTVINANIVTAGGALDFDDAVQIGQPDIEIDTTNNGGAAGAAITFRQTINSEPAEVNSLAVTTGVGNTMFMGQVGADDPLNNLVTDAGTGVTQFLAALVRTLGDQLYNDGVQVLVDAVLTAATSDICFFSTLSTSASDVTLEADEIDFMAAVSGTGDLALFQFTQGIAYELADVITSAGFDLTLDELLQLQNGFAEIAFGRSLGTGRMTIRTSTYFDPAIFRMDGSSGGITVAGDVSGSDDSSITVIGTGTTTDLFGSIRTNGNPITIQDSLRLSAAGLVLDSTNGGAAAAGADVMVMGAINSVPLAERSLSILAGNSGDTTVTGSIGSAPNSRLGSFTTDPGGQTTLNSPVITTRDAITFADPVVLAGPVVVTTQGAPITFGGTLNGQQNLTINTGSGPTTFSGEVGGGAPLASLTINAGSTRIFQAPVTIGTLTVVGGTVVFNGPATCTSGVFIAGIIEGSGDITFSLPITWINGIMRGTGRTIVQPAATLVLTGGFKSLERELVNEGVTYWVDGDLNINGGTFRNRPFSTFYIQSIGMIAGSGSFINEGLLERFEISGTSTITGLTFTNTARILVPEGVLNIVPAGGIFTNQGVITAQPGGVFRVTGDLVLTASSVVEFTVVGAGVGEAGRIEAIGSAALDGRIVVTSINFIPPQGTAIDLIVGASVNGTFATQTLPNFAPVSTAQVTYTPTSARLFAGIGADANGDSVVNADDIFFFLNAWFGQIGGPGSADINGDGVVNADDIFFFLNSWFANL